MLLELRSAKRAGERLGLSQPAVSHALRRLRTAFADPLFVRDGQGLRPTQRALDLRGRLDDLKFALDRLITDIPFDVARLDRTVRIASVDYLQLQVARALEPMFRAAPAAGLAMVPLETADDLFDNGRIDLVVTLRGVASSSHRVRKLSDDHYVVLMRRGSLSADVDLDLAAFAAAAHVLISPRGMGMRAAVDDRLDALGLTRRIKLAVSSFWTAAQLVERSDLLATVPYRFAHLAAAALDLAILPLPLALEPIQLSMIWEESRHADPAHVWLRQTLARQFAGQAGS